MKRMVAFLFFLASFLKKLAWFSSAMFDAGVMVCCSWMLRFVWNRKNVLCPTKAENSFNLRPLFLHFADIDSSSYQKCLYLKQKFTFPLKLGTWFAASSKKAVLDLCALMRAQLSFG